MLKLAQVNKANTKSHVKLYISHVVLCVAVEEIKPFGGLKFCRSAGLWGVFA